MIGVVSEEPRQERLDIALDPFARQRPGDERPRPVADEPLDHRQGRRGHRHLGERRRQRRGDVRGGVDERAVEVEDDEIEGVHEIGGEKLRPLTVS